MCCSQRDRGQRTARPQSADGSSNGSHEFVLFSFTARAISVRESKRQLTLVVYFDGNNLSEIQRRQKYQHVLD